MEGVKLKEGTFSFIGKKQEFNQLVLEIFSKSQDPALEHILVMILIFEQRK